MLALSSSGLSYAMPAAQSLRRVAQAPRAAAVTMASPDEYTIAVLGDLQGELCLDSMAGCVEQRPNSFMVTRSTH